MGKDKYMCQLCANHGAYEVPKRGHKERCPYKKCDCETCDLNNKRRQLDQLERTLKRNDRQDPAPGIDNIPISRASSSQPQKQVIKTETALGYPPPIFAHPLPQWPIYPPRMRQIPVGMSSHSLMLPIVSADQMILLGQTQSMPIHPSNSVSSCSPPTARSPQGNGIRKKSRSQGDSVSPKGSPDSNSSSSKRPKKSFMINDILS